VHVDQRPVSPAAVPQVEDHQDGDEEVYEKQVKSMTPALKQKSEREDPKNESKIKGKRRDGIISPEKPKFRVVRSRDYPHKDDGLHQQGKGGIRPQVVWFYNWENG
jgi:hypothetical protein